MMLRGLLLATVAAVSPLVHADCDAFRVVVEQRGQSGFAVRLLDVNDHPCVPVGLVTLVVTAQDGEIHALTGLPREGWSQTFSRPFRPSDAFPSFEFRTSHRWWPEDITVTASVQRANRPPAESKPLTIPIRPPVETALLLAIIGALLWSALELEHAKRRDRKTILTGVGVGLASGIVAYFAAETTFIWQAVGFEASPLRPQSYFLLGLAIAAIGIRTLLQKVTGKQGQAVSVTPESLRSEVMTLLNSDVVRRPFRDEVCSIIFDDNYVTLNRHLIPRLEFALAAAKAGASFPAGLTDHVAPRLEPLYAGSYRRNFQAVVEGNIDVAKRIIEWKHSIYYEFIRNRADAGEPEVKHNHVVHVPEALQNLSAAKLQSLGPVVQSMRLSLRDAGGGSPLVYEAESGGMLLRTKAPKDIDSDDSIDLHFEHDPTTHEMAAGITFPFPPAFRSTSQVIVEIEVRAISELEDGLTWWRVTRLTEGFHVRLQFTPKVHLDIVEFEWKHPGKETTTIDREAGSAHLTGWLLPGNGVCLSWTGTKQLAAGVEKKDERSRAGVLRRVLNFIFGKR